MILYTDAGTKHNGMRGNQVTRIAVADENGSILFEKLIGDYTNNEGEILGIIAALKNVAPGSKKDIYSDSQIAVNWILKGWSKKMRNKHLRTVGEKLHNRLAYFIDTAITLHRNSGSVIHWIPRELNKAGWYLEDKYCI